MYIMEALHVITLESFLHFLSAVFQAVFVFFSDTQKQKLLKILPTEFFLYAPVPIAIICNVHLPKPVRHY
jgi:hypothetical protein